MSDRLLSCEYCGNEFYQTGKRGLKPKFCKPTHRRRAHEKRTEQKRTNMSDVLPPNMPTDLGSSAVAMHEVFTNLRQAGFTEPQAIALLAAMISAPKPKSEDEGHD